MASRGQTLYRLCRWYLNENKCPMTQEELITLYKFIIGKNGKPTPSSKYDYNMGKQVLSREEAEEISFTTDPAIQFWFHLQHDCLEKSPIDCNLRWAWDKGIDKYFPNEKL